MRLTPRLYLVGSGEVGTYEILIVDVRLKFDYSGRRASVDDDFIQRGKRIRSSRHRRRKAHPLLDAITAGDNLRKKRLPFIEGYLRKKAELTEIYAKDRHSQ